MVFKRQKALAIVRTQQKAPNIWGMFIQTLPIADYDHPNKPMYTVSVAK